MNFHLIFGQKLISPIKLPAPMCPEEETSQLNTTIRLQPRLNRKLGSSSAYLRANRRRSCVSYHDGRGNRSFFHQDTLWLDFERLKTPLGQAQLIKEFLSLTASLGDSWLLHASAFSIEGNAILVLGQSGFGKSTFAAAAHAMGATHLSDDASIIVKRSGRAVIIPSGTGCTISREMIDQICKLNPKIMELFFSAPIDQYDKVWSPRLSSFTAPYYPISEIVFITKDTPPGDSQLALRMLIQGVISGKQFAKQLAPFYLPFFGELLRQCRITFINPQRDFEELTNTYSILKRRYPAKEAKL